MADNRESGFVPIEPAAVDLTAGATTATQEQKSRRLNKQPLLWLGASAILVIVIIAFYATPYLTVYQLKTAAQNHDGEALSEYIDFPALRQNLKDQLNAQLGKELAQEAMDDNPFIALGAAFGGMLVGTMIDVFVTPAGIIELMKGEKPSQKGIGGAMEKQTNSEPFKDVSTSYESFSKFSITVKQNTDLADEVKFVLRRRGIGWKLTEILFDLPGTLGSTPAPSSPSAQAEVNVSQSPGGATATGEAPWRKAQQFSQRKESQEILQQLLDAQKALEQSGVTVWGRKEYERAVEHARSGDAEYSRQNFEQAHEHYVRALEIFNGLLDGMEQLFADTMQAGVAALSAGDAAAATEAFGVALAIDPIDRDALLGMERASTVSQVMELVDAGDARLRASKPEEAVTLYQQALDIDSHSERASQQLQTAQSQIRDNEFNAAMSTGFSLLEQGRHGEAHEAFSGALKLKPRSRAARNGLEQAQHRITSEKINEALKQAGAAEQNEDWQGAVSAYDVALKLDGSLGNAREARQRAELRNEIHTRLEQILARPERLFDADVYNEVAGFRDRIQALSEPGPVLARQLAGLNRILALADTPVTVELRSDNLTLVTVYKVGELGYFTSKTLSLRPGNYVAVGRRDGYRDVRVEFFVDPDEAIEPVVVSSSEKIALGN